MPTIVSGKVPSEDFLLDEPQRTWQDLTFEAESVVRSGDEALIPMMWARGETGREVVESVAADPTVSDVTEIGHFDDEMLLQIEWDGMVSLVVEMITNSHATILDAVGSEGEWDLRVFYPQRPHFSKTYDFCAQHGIDFDVDSIREVEGEPEGRYGLTSEQYEVLVLAAKRGYFEIPRKTNLEDLSEEFDVSHQALSERLRRATDALLDNTLLV